MDFSLFHFAQGAWLWGLLAIPVMFLLYVLLYRAESTSLLERFADRHLLPHLVKTPRVAARNIRTPLLLWSAAWVCGIVAMAGPRWSYMDEPTFRAPLNLVIVLDLSQTMNATDVKPSRIVRAREEIEDLLDMSRGTSIGLVAYAAVPHMVTPLTDDLRTIRNLLPALDTSLVTIQGDRLKPALDMAAAMLKAEPGDDKSILVIGDGGFQEDDFAALARAAGNATIYTMGVGTGLDTGRLQTLAATGHGLFVEANYTDSDTRAILDRVEAAGDKASMTQKSARVWADQFYVPALVLALLLLRWFRKGAAFPAVVLLSMMFYPAGPAKAVTAADLFLNREQQARAAYQRGDYKKAMKEFDTPYRRGVAAYRAGDYDKAAVLFKNASRQKGGLDALYDLGNAQLMQGRVEDAVASYEAVLKQRPGDVGARHNLAIALKLLAQNKQQQKQKKQPQSQEPQDKQKGGKQSQQQSKSEQQKSQGSAKNPAQATPGSKQQSEQSKDSRQDAQRQQQQQARSQPAAPQNGAAPPSGRDGAIGGATQRPQRDVTADEWLGRVPSDPGSFLRNQFAIEDRKSGLAQGARP